MKKKLDPILQKIHKVQERAHTCLLFTRFGVPEELNRRRKLPPWLIDGSLTADVRYGCGGRWRARPQMFLAATRSDAAIDDSADLRRFILAAGSVRVPLVLFF